MNAIAVLSKMYYVYINEWKSQETVKYVHIRVMVKQNWYERHFCKNKESIQRLIGKCNYITDSFDSMKLKMQWALWAYCDINTFR